MPIANLTFATTTPRAFAITTALAALSFTAACNPKSKIENPKSISPNIIFVLADDGGSHDFGFQDNPALAQLTPNLDQLRRESLRFTHAYANASMCAPSRAALLTGRYPHRFGFQQNYPEGDTELFKRTWSTDAWRTLGIDPSEKTVADHLKANGYATALVGKWHLGYDDAFHPDTRGFGHFWGLRGGSRAYFSAPELETAPPPKKYDRIEAGRAFVPENQITYITDDLTAGALRFISEKRDGPFYVFLSYTAPHTPLTARHDDVEWVQKNLPPTDMKRVQNLALIRGVDRGMGELRAGLEKLGLSQNTIIIFAVDNGGSIRGLADNTPHRGHKFSPFEGGLRVPLIACWPGVTKPGADSHAPVMLFDFAPTFVEIAGGKTASGAKPFDASSLAPLLKGEAKSPGPRDLFWREINSQGPTKTMRRDNHKLIQYENRAPELYDVVADPGEKTNLAPRQPDLVRQLISAYAQWESRMPAPRWYQEDPK
jgi:arylsulfatase A-like enzyme